MRFLAPILICAFGGCGSVHDESTVGTTVAQAFDYAPDTSSGKPPIPESQAACATLSGADVIECAPVQDASWWADYFRRRRFIVAVLSLSKKEDAVVAENLGGGAVLVSNVVHSEYSVVAPVLGGLLGETLHLTYPQPGCKDHYEFDDSYKGDRGAVVMCNKAWDTAATSQGQQQLWVWSAGVTGAPFAIYDVGIDGSLDALGLDVTVETLRTAVSASGAPE